MKHYHKDHCNDASLTVKKKYRKNIGKFGKGKTIDTINYTIHSFQLSTTIMLQHNLQ